jgi:aspartate/glutamate racemase
MNRPALPGPRIALVHAVYAAMKPIESAFARHWPEAVRANLVDDTLAPDLERDGRLTDAMVARIRRLAEHGVSIGAQGVLFTCSAFGDAIAAAATALPVPVLKPNEPMFDAAIGSGRALGMIATFAPAVQPMEEEFRALARARGSDATLQTVCVPEAMQAARAGDVAAHDRLVARAAPALAHCDAILLAHFSTATALAAVREAVACPVFSAPDAAVLEMRRRIGARC